MKEKHEEAVADEKPEARTPRRMTNSTTEADSDGLSSHRVSKYEKDEGAGPEGHPRSDDEIERPLDDDDADIDHDEAEATVPGHDLDVELGRVCLRPPLHPLHPPSTSPSSGSIPAVGFVLLLPAVEHETTSQAAFSSGGFPWAARDRFVMGYGPSVEMAF